MSSDYININNDKNKNPKKKWIILGILVVVIALLGFCVYRIVDAFIPKEYDRVTIVNGDSLKDTRGEKVNEFRSSLLHLLIEKGLIADNANISDVTVRDGSYLKYLSYSDDGKKTVLSKFIVDIDSVK